MSNEERKPISLRILLFFDDQFERLSSLGHRFEERWQQLFSRIDLEAIGDFFSRRDFQLFGVLLWSTRPIVLVCCLILRIIGWSCKRLAASPLLRPLLASLAWIFDRTLRGPCIALLAFVAEFFRSRHPLTWQYSALAILIFSIGTCVSLQVASNQNQVSKLYRQAVDLEIENGNFDRVSLYQVKLAQLGVEYGQPELQTILQLERQGRLEDAYALAEKYAPVDHPGMAAAHLYQAVACLSHRSGLPRPKANQLAESHLNHLKTLHQRFAGDEAAIPVELKFLYASLRLNQNRFAEGLEFLDDISPNFWPATITSLEVHSQLNLPLAALEDSQNLSRLIRRQSALLDNLEAKHFAIWYHTLKHMATTGRLNPESHTAARRECRFVAEQWCHRFPDHPEAAVALFLECKAEIESLAQQGLSEKQRAAILLNRSASGIGIKNRMLLANWLLPQLKSGPDSDFEESQDLWDVVRQATSEPTAPPCLLELAGTAELAAGHPERALELLKRVVAVEPNHAVAWNNLAVLIKRHRLEPLRSAYDAAERAVQLEPDNHAMRLTRAMIAIEMEAWQVAKEDLQRVLQSQPDNPELHGYLALSYQRLGEVEQHHFHALLAGR